MKGRRNMKDIHELLNFTVWSLGGPSVVSTPKEIDIFNIDPLLHGLLVAVVESPVVVLDMTATDLCDSGGYHIVGWMSEWLHENGGELRLVYSGPRAPFVTLPATDMALRVFSSLPGALLTNTQLCEEVGFSGFAGAVACRFEARLGRVVTECPWCNIDSSIPQIQRKREYERALRCHQVHETQWAGGNQDRNVICTFGSGAQSYRERDDHSRGKKAA
jgi:anti-anti-sigma regulatory factor